MRNLTATICLMIAVLLGGGGVSFYQSSGDTWSCDRKNYIEVFFEGDYSRHHKDYPFSKRNIEWRSNNRFHLGWKNKHYTFNKISDDGWYMSESENSRTAIYIRRHKNIYRVVEHEPATTGGEVWATRIHNWDCVKVK